MSDLLAVLSDIDEFMDVIDSLRFHTADNYWMNSNCKVLVVGNCASYYTHILYRKEDYEYVLIIKDDRLYITCKSGVTDEDPYYSDSDSKPDLYTTMEVPSDITTEESLFQFSLLHDIGPLSYEEINRARDFIIRFDAKYPYK